MSDNTEPLDFLAAVLVVAAVLLLLGGVLFAFASTSAMGDAAGVANQRFRLLGQAANPFIAFLLLAAIGLVVHDRRQADPSQRGSGPVMAVATATALAVALLALNGILSDITSESGGMVKLSAVVSRLATVVLSALALWTAATAPRLPSG